MDNSPLGDLSTLLQLGFFLLLTACIAVWIEILRRLRRGEPVLPYEPRRPVPWKFVDTAGVLIGYLALAFWLSFVVQRAFGVPMQPDAQPVSRPQIAIAEKPLAAEPENSEKPPELTHPIIVILQSRPSSATLLFCLMVAGLIAPVTEEIMFRLLLQGWLESEERSWRRRFTFLRRLTPGLGPIVLVSAMFALAHYRTDRSLPAVETLIYLFTVDAAAKIIALSLGLALIWRLRGATLADFGIVPGKIGPGLRLGLLAYLASVPIVLIIQAVTTYLLPDWLAADPISLFVFATMLGTLYYRTHRIVSAIVTHMALNITTLAAVWLLVAR